MADKEEEVSADPGDEQKQVPLEEGESVVIGEELRPGDEAVVVEEEQRPARESDQDIYDRQEAEKIAANEERQERLGNNPDRVETAPGEASESGHTNPHENVDPEDQAS